jgi:hypothetical protein
LRFVDPVGPIGALVAVDGLVEVVAGEVEVGQVHVDEAAVEVALGEASGVVAAFAQREHLVGELERSPVLGP